MKKKPKTGIFLLAQGKTKIYLTMKLILFLISISLLNASGSIYSQNVTFNLSADGMTVKEVIRDIEKQSNYRFLYNDDFAGLNRLVSIFEKERNLGDLLGEILTGANLTYRELENDLIVITPLMLDLQQVTVTGRVTDGAAGESLPGVSVVIDGTTTGVITDIDGRFSITVPNENAIIVFSFVGYSTRRIPLEGRSVLEIDLTPVAIDLDEVVVIGYGTQRRATLTGSVAGISDQEITRTPAANLSNALAGLLPGLISMQRGGTPGADNSVFLVRGNTTTGDNTPLILVDGVPEPGWQRINPNDVESISVLKDASAAIYGVQAANGVILITTKRGSVGKPRFDFSFNQSITTPTRVPEMAGSALLAEYANEFLMRHGGDPMWTEAEIQKFRDGSDPINYPNTNWIEETFKSFSTQNVANLNIGGGADNIMYRISGSYNFEDDLLRDGMHAFKGYTIRTNIDSEVSQNIRLSLDVNAGLDDRTSPMRGGLFYYTNPQIPFTYPGGYPSDPPGDYGNHPLINNSGGSGYDNSLGRRFSSKASFDVNFPWIEGLGADGYFVYNNTNGERKRWDLPWTYYSWDREKEEVIPNKGGYVALPTLQQDYESYTSDLVHMRLKYERQFTDHYLNMFMAVEQSKGFNNSFMAFRRNFISSAIDEIFAGSVDNMNTGGTSSRNARQNLFGRLSYNFQEKYLIDFNFRYDGTYRFPKDNRWGFFPGISAAWRISEEYFIRDNFDFLNDLKLRASYGQIGNDAIPAFQFLQGYNLRTSGYHFGERGVTTVPGVFPGVSPNPNITWEVSTISNIGVDALFFDHLLGVTIDVFQQRRTNILTTRALAVPVYAGLSLPRENIGIVDSRGIELALNHRNNLSVGRGLSYFMSGNFAFSKNNVIDVAEAADVPSYQKMEGAILGAGLYYQALGIIRTQEQLESLPLYPGTQVGDLYYEDIDGDGMITAADRVRMNKSVIPEITFGYNMSVQYSNFSLFAHFAGQARAWWYIHRNARVSLNAPKELLENRYTPGSMDSKYPWVPQMETTGAEVSGLRSTFWLQNAAFLRLKTAELSYSIPQRLISRYNIDNMRVYLSGSNLFTLSEIKWYDPEGSNERAEFYPQRKIFNLGVQLTF
jgi:TonB-dependent starch-binding outer membrane protein SusC